MGDRRQPWVPGVRLTRTATDVLSGWSPVGPCAFQLISAGTNDVFSERRRQHRRDDDGSPRRRTNAFVVAGGQYFCITGSSEGRVTTLVLKGNLRRGGPPPLLNLVEREISKFFLMAATSPKSESPARDVTSGDSPVRRWPGSMAAHAIVGESPGSGVLRRRRALRAFQ